ncbi:42085_t:CDS:2, partial [Gigaspora margarita]
YIAKTDEFSELCFGRPSDIQVQLVAETQHKDFMQSTKQGDEKNNIDPGELSEPIKQNTRCIIFKTLYKLAIEVLRDLKLGNFGFKKEVYGHNTINVSRSQNFNYYSLQLVLECSYGSFVMKNLADREIQLEFIKIIQDVDYPEIEEEIPEEVCLLYLLKMCMEIFKQNDDLDNPEAKFWVGYHLLYRHRGEKDPIQTGKYFKEAADENNHAESQCRCAASLIINLKKRLIKLVLFGDIYVTGKLKIKKDEERGLNYLRLDANDKTKEQLLY